MSKLYKVTIPVGNIYNDILISATAYQVDDNGILKFYGNDKRNNSAFKEWFRVITVNANYKQQESK